MVGLISVSDYGNILQNQGRIAALRERMTMLQNQVSTGKKTPIFGGLGVDASVTLSFRAQTTRLESYNTAITRVLTRTSVMDTAMKNMSDATSQLVADMRGVTQSSEPSDIAKTQRSIEIIVNSAKEKLPEIIARLNTRVDGRYIFSGDQVDVAPVPDSSVLNTNINTIVDAYKSGTTAAAVLTNLDGMSADDLGLDSDLATAGNIVVRADDNLDLDYTVKADIDPIQNILRGVGALSQMEFDENHITEFWSIFNGIVDMLDNAGRDLDTVNGKLGQTRQQLTDLQTQHSDLQTTIEGNITNIEDIDPADAITNINALQIQLQATYQLVSMLKDMSLVNFF